MLKCKIIGDKIFFPKNEKYVDPNIFTIFSAKVAAVLVGDYSLRTIKLKGKINKPIQKGTTLTIKATLADSHPIYGDTYEIFELELPTNLENSTDPKTFLATIVSENTADEIVKTIPNILEVLNNRNIKTLTSVKGIGEIKAVKLIEKYDEIKDYEKDIYSLY